MSTVRGWIDYINSIKRPQLTKALLKHNLESDVYPDNPEGRHKDLGDEITLMVTDKYQNLCWYFSQVVDGENGKKQEIFGAALATKERIIKMLNLQPEQQHETTESATATPQHQKHNERGAGRKPLNYELQREIAECVTSGKSIRATAKELCISTRTVQKYAKILVM